MSRVGFNGLSSVSIVQRFYQAWDYLYAAKRIESKRDFCETYALDRRNFDRLRNEPQRLFQVHILSILVCDFGISAEWILTGKGSMFTM